MNLALIRSRRQKNRPQPYSSYQYFKAFEFTGVCARSSSRETLTMGQVRPLLSLENAQEQEKLAQIIAEQGLSARAVEEIVKKIKNGEEITFENDAEKTKKEKTTRKNKKTEISVYCRDFQNRLIELLGTKVKIVPKNEKQGKIEIEYYSAEDLERIYELLEQQPKQNKIKREKFTV